MRKAERLLLAALTACLMFFETGCWDAKDVDNRLLVGALGIQKISDSTLRVWLRFPLPKPATVSDGEKKDFFTVSQEAPTVEDAMNHARYKLPKALDPSSTRAMLIDEEAAKSGLKAYLEFAIRERSVPLDAVVAIVKGEMQSIFESRNPIGELSGIYTKLFFESYAGGIPRKNKVALWEVYAKLYNPMQANLIPVLKRDKQNSFMLTGNAFFVEDRLAGMLTSDESLVYAMITHRFRESEIELMSRADLKIIHNHSSIHASMKGTTPVIRVETWVTCTLADRSRSQNMDEQEIRKELEAELLQLSKSMLEKTQRSGSDIFGFGNRYRGRIQPDHYKEWSGMFKRADISCLFHVNLRNTGLEFLND